MCSGAILIPIKSGGRLVLIAIYLVILGVFLQATFILWPFVVQLVPYLTGNISSQNPHMFHSKLGGFPVIVNAPQEIRPGMNFKIMIRGAEYQDLVIPKQVAFSIISSSLDVTYNIKPDKIEKIPASGEKWLLPTQEVSINTVNISKPPKKILFQITEIVTSNDKTLYKETGSLSVALDLTPIPIPVLIQEIISFLVVVLGPIIYKRKQ